MFVYAYVKSDFRKKLFRNKQNICAYIGKHKMCFPSRKAEKLGPFACANDKSDFIHKMRFLGRKVLLTIFFPMFGTEAKKKDHSWCLVHKPFLLP